MTPPHSGPGNPTPRPSASRGPRALRAVGSGEAAPARRVVGRQSDNLPLELTSFVGREREVAALEELLGRNRLLTLTGPGGAGKTRLALAVTSEVVERFRDGAWWAGLASLSDPEHVPQAVAFSVPDVREQPDRALIDTLAEVLREKELLLVMDNCEHLVDACAALADHLLRSCPGLKILATSREALAVAGEMVWPVPPLALPDPARALSVEELRRYETVRLFSDRAKAAGASFELDAKNVPAVVQACRRLEGVPLAIELAAARARVLSVEQIAARLDESLRLLSSGSRTTDNRQRSLAATIDWSHELLSDEEQTLFRRLSVFVGGWTLESAERVCAGNGVEGGEILDLLTRLVAKSLVSVADLDGEARYRFLETIRQYGAERLEASGEEQGTRRRHAEYFLALAERLELAMWGAEEEERLVRLKAEQDNLRTALSWATERDADAGLRLAGALRWFWYWRGSYGEGRGWLEGALTRDRKASVTARAKALHAVGWLAHDQGDMDRAEAAAEEGIGLSTMAPIERSYAASFRNLLGEAARHRGDFERATTLVEEGMALYQQEGDERGVAWSLFLLGNASSWWGDHKRAKALYEKGSALSRRLGGAQPLGDCLSHLGYECLLEGDHERALVLNEEAAELLRRQEYRGGLQFALKNLGWAALARDDHKQAAILHRESLRLCRELGDRLVASESIEGLACAAVASGESKRAAKMFGAAQALREASGYQPAPREGALRGPWMETARSKTDDSTWIACFAEGSGMTFTEAVEYGLRGAEPAPAPTTAAGRDHYPAGLSAREIEVLGLVAEGLTNARVAKALFISPNTVNRHLNSIYQKLGVSSRAAATRFALEHDLA